MDIRFLGHACFELSDGDTRVLIDPFLTGNPKAAVEASELDRELVQADWPSRPTGSTVSNHEIAA